MSEEALVSKVYGIDLGTTYSAISYINEDGKPEIIKNMEGDSITPSVVLFEESKTPGKPNIVVGKVAKDSGKTSPENVVAFIKQEMGTAWEQEILGVKWTPQKISSCVLRKLKDDAKLADFDVKDVVITCPAYFDEAQREATRDAGEMAGLNVLGIIDEPAAAAMHYGLNKVEGDRTAIVYDLGGGTFDVTVIKITNTEGQVNVEVVCSDGNHRLGGKNWDDRMVQLLASKFSAAASISEDEVLGDTDTLYSLQTMAELAKMTLTARPVVKQKVTHGGTSERVEVTREEFDEATKDLLGETVALTNKMFELAKEKGVEKINDFLLVGGSTRMPQVIEMVKTEFASRVDTEPKLFEVDEAVSKGAAMFAYIRAIQIGVEKIADKLKEKAVNALGENASDEAIKEAQDNAEKEAQRIVAEDLGLEVEAVKKTVDTGLKTVASRSYGIRLLKEGQPVVYNMIVKQNQVPTEYEQEFPVSEDNAEKLPLKVFANNILEKVAAIEDSELVGEAEMLLPPNTPKGAKIRVKFALTESGVLAISAVDVASGTMVEATFEAKNGLTQEQIEQARNEIAELEMV